MDFALVQRPKMEGLRTAGTFKFGIEEEYFLVDAETKSVVPNMPQPFFEAAKAATDGRISPEFLQPQIEVISSPHDNMTDARAELRALRQAAVGWVPAARMASPCSAATVEMVRRRARSSARASATLS